jgi:hypothetical protein
LRYSSYQAISRTIACATSARAGARRELGHAVADLGGFGEHHGGPGAHQQVGAEAHGRIGGDAGESVAAAALHADDQLARRHRLATAGIQLLQVHFGLPHDGIHHRHEADVRVVLQPHHVERRLGCFAALVYHRDGAGRQQPFGLKLLAAQAHHHHLAAEVRVEADVAQCADRDLRVGRIDRHAAAVAVLQRNHVVDVRVTRQQLLADAVHRELGDTGHALHGLRDGQDVAGAHAAIGVAVALEGVALQRRLRRCPGGGHRQVGQAGRVGHGQQAFMDPAAGGNVLQRAADDHVVAPHLGTGRKVHQRHLVALGNALAQGEAVGEAGARLDAAVVGHDGDVVRLVHADPARAGVHRHGSVFSRQ